MWPDDYIDWARRARPQVLRMVEQGLDVLLARAAAPLRAGLQGLARRAVFQAFRRADAHRRHPEYFADEAAFRVWLVTVALREAVRLLLRGRRVRRSLNLLPADQRRVLGMVYLDQLSYADIGAILGLGADEVSRRRQAAQDALCQLL